MVLISTHVTSKYSSFTSSCIGWQVSETNCDKLCLEIRIEYWSDELLPPVLRDKRVASSPANADMEFLILASCFSI